jgi:hippurate hydrolase
MDLNRLHEEAARLLPETIELRRRIHRRPELGLELPETQRAVLDALEGLDLEVHTGGSTSAVVAELRGARPGRTLLLRADMDALPMPEDTGLPFASEVDGAMHACGHDAHTAMLAGAAKLLHGMRDELAGTVKFLFQPGEEGFGGMRILIEEGLLASTPRVEGAFALHMDSTLPAGTIATRPGAILASADVFSVDVKGKGGHAALPHLARDPIVVACEMVASIQGLVTRRMNAFDPVLVSVTRMRAGTTTNVIPETASFQGTIRTVSPAARKAIHEKLRRLVEGIAAAHGIEAEFHLVPGYPVTVNHDEFAEFASEVAGTLLGDDRVVRMPSPMMGAEDFSYALEQVPGALAFLGARADESVAAPLHSNRMILDESAFAAGIALHAAVALRWSAAE